jgi:protein-tyrosine phosphatase
VVVLCAKELQNLRFPAKVHVIKAPLDDGPPPTATELRMAISAARTVHHFRKKGKRVLVTCAQGVNRSSFVAALALMLDGRPPNMAIHAIRENRKPPIGMTPLSNRHFVAELERLGRRRYAQNQPASAL